ncbi:MAG: hypothetical protein A2X56_12790 [Nitrospirae bacterium GWC2_57_13]|jgi:nucleotide-binding universal stress UspA family protein|nr:MAG: hypothetical protein A2072_06725 [Nitrospirae bacterium GWC1_57_7]OGW27773.1 MAG: hypothetical protein A2X56_12790 [Nitrospirae bacterium GWC2_57_13]HAR46228.1 hypothetical protein [Nitrospiraceae bacterium]
MRYQRILTAINEHVQSEIAARYALQFAAAAGACLDICFVEEPGHQTEHGQIARAAAERMQNRAKAAGVPCRLLYERGDPLTEIRRIVKTDVVDLVFVATRGEDVKRRFYTGTMARRLSRGLPCSVALVRVVHLGRIHPKEILVPLKSRLSHAAERAAFIAVLSRAFDSRVHLFHVTRPLRTFFHGEMHLTPLEWDQRLPADISRFIEELNRRRTAHERRLAPGVAGRVISVEAAVRRHDLIVMGASERGRAGSLLRGNPVEQVLRETPCDLIVLKPVHENQ